MAQHAHACCAVAECWVGREGDGVRWQQWHDNHAIVVIMSLLSPLS